MSSIRYRIYPSLLDKFQALLDVDQTVEEFWNLDSEGDYKETADEMSDRLEKELLDAVNRVPHDPIEAADKGTCFNEVIDCLISDKKCEREDMFIRSDYMGGNRVIIANLNEFEFIYDAAMCVEFADAYNRPISQHRCEANISTRYGDVELYGYADEIEEDVVYDIKTTGRYDFGKYAKGWQRHVYPYCLVKSGELTDVSAFVFDVVVWSGGSTRNPILGGKFYRETYDFHYEQSELAIRQVCERFIEWLEAHREQITDKKIFAED